VLERSLRDLLQFPLISIKYKKKTWQSLYSNVCRA
jgi:hypothetical protein